MNTTVVETARPCTRCGGATTITYQLAAGPKTSDCTWCKNRGVGGFYDKPAYKDIVRALYATRGPNKGKIRTSAPDYSSRNLHQSRTYYVWRLYRFHAGIKPTLPMTAGFLIESDPWEDELDQLAYMLAVRFTPGKENAPQGDTGHSSAGRARWRRALGSPAAAEGATLGMPASAFEGGAVVTDDNKPDEEALELR